MWNENDQVAGLLAIYDKQGKEEDYDAADKIAKYIKPATEALISAFAFELLNINFPTLFVVQERVVQQQESKEAKADIDLFIAVFENADCRYILQHDHIDRE